MDNKYSQQFRVFGPDEMSSSEIRDTLESILDDAWIQRMHESSIRADVEATARSEDLQSAYRDVVVVTLMLDKCYSTIYTPGEYVGETAVPIDDRFEDVELSFTSVVSSVSPYTTD